MPYGSGSIRERSPGVWRLRVYVGDDPVSGRPIQVHRTFKGSKAGARKELARFQVEAQKCKITRGDATVGDLLDRWLEHVEGIGKARPKTVYEYRRKIEGRIRPALGSVPLAMLGADQLDDWYLRWLEMGLSHSTVHVYHSILSAACRQGVKWGWLDSAPTARATPPAPNGAKMVIPTPEQLRILLKAASTFDPVLETAIALATLTGARRGELVALKWSDVDLETGRIRIARSITVINGETIAGPTKTHQVRDVALDDLGIATLLRRHEYMEKLSAEACSPLVADPYVLSYNANGGRRVGPDTLTHRFGYVCNSLSKSADGREWNFRFHDLRHFSVTTLIAAGVDVRTVAERHGHAQATMTLNRYAHALPERDREAATVLGNALSIKNKPKIQRESRTTSSTS